MLNGVYFKGRLYDFDNPNKGDCKFYSSVGGLFADVAYNNKTHHYIEWQNGAIRFNEFIDYNNLIDGFIDKKMWKLIDNIYEIPKELFDAAMGQNENNIKQ